MRIEGGAFSVNNTTFKQCSYGFGAGEFMDLPTNQINVELQTSCDNNSRTTQQIVVVANEVDGTQRTASETLNGQTAVTLDFSGADDHYRIVSIVCTSNTMDSGGDFGTGATDIVYVSPNGTSLTNGVPDSNIIGTMSLGHGISKLGYLHIPPNRTFIPNSGVLISNKALNMGLRLFLPGLLGSSSSEV